LFELTVFVSILVLLEIGLGAFLKIAGAIGVRIKIKLKNKK